MGVLSWVSIGKLLPYTIDFSFVENENFISRISTFQFGRYWEKFIAFGTTNSQGICYFAVWL
jgi:hypothetical protein